MKTLFFSPFSYIWEHSSAEMAFMRSLVNSDVETWFVKCNRSFSNFCIAMDSARLETNSSYHEKEKICKSCVENSSLISKMKNLNTVQLEDYYDHNTLFQIEQMLGSVTRENFQLTYDEVPFYKVAMYEIILKYKFKTVELDDEQFSHFKITLSNCLKVYIASKKILEKINPDNIIIYSPQYAINNAFSKAAEKLQIPVYFIEGTDNLAHRYNNTRMWKWDKWKLVNPTKSYWETYKNCYFPDYAYSRVTDHFKELLRGTNFSVYSEAQSEEFNVYTYFNIPVGESVALLSMSSHDEAFAALYIDAFPKEKVKSQVFADQVEWVRTTIDFFASNPNKYLIIRIHPRDFPNKRDGVMSPQYKELQEFFLNQLPPNVKINWPAQKVSIYNLFESVDYLLTGWSATALEASLYDLPVVLYDQNLPSYPVNSFYVGETKDKYFENLKLAMTGKLAGDAKLAMHWWAMNHFLNCVDIQKGKGYKSFLIWTHKLFKLLKFVGLNLYTRFPIRKLGDVIFNKLHESSKQRVLNVLLDSKETLLDKDIPFNEALLKAGPKNFKAIENELEQIKSLFKSAVN